MNSSYNNGNSNYNSNQNNKKDSFASSHYSFSEPPSQPVIIMAPKPPPMSLEESKAIALKHFLTLRNWLEENRVATGSSRNNARDKLTRLTRQQFQELSTDVYDELIRRVEDAAGRAGNG